jgi:hypothetical protein
MLAESCCNLSEAFANTREDSGNLLLAPLFQITKTRMVDYKFGERQPKTLYSR